MPTPPALKARAVPDVDLLFHPEHDATYRHFENADEHPFEHDARTVTRRNAWWLADAALLSYWPPGVAIERFRAAGMEDAEFVEDHGTQCYISWAKEFVIVCFRGTQPDQWQDIFDDLRFALVPWRQGTNVHEGFKAALERVWDRVDRRVSELAVSRTVWFTGHSLGAALATLAADRFLSTKALCTIGSSRIGDKAFALAMDARFGDRNARYVDDADVVAHIPPRVPFPYEHTGMLRQIRADGVVVSTPSIDSFFLQLIGNVRHLLELTTAAQGGTIRQLPDFLLDHMPKAYAVDMWNDYARNGALNFA